MSQNQSIVESKYERYCQQCYQSPRLTRVFQHFGDIGAGKIQVPTKLVEVDKQFLHQDPELLAYHQLFQQNMGHFYKHYCTSVPFILEELYRLGLAISRLAKYLSRDEHDYFCLYNTTGEGDVNGITMAKYSQGLIRTFTNNPNIEGQNNFERFCNSEYSKFHLGSYIEITLEYLASRPDLELYREGFNCIYASITFQVYGSNRFEQISYMKRLLKNDGLMIIHEKLKHPNSEEYQKYEEIKDKDFKCHYYSKEEIDWKKSTLLQECIQYGQIDFDTCISAIKGHFKYVYLIWNSGNFYEFAASNNQEVISKFISLLVETCMPDRFTREKIMVRQF